MNNSDALLIVNPTAGGSSRRGLARAIKRLRHAGMRLELRMTAQPGDARQWSADAAARGLPWVIIMGGDGAINEAADGLAGSSTRLGILPAGTANVLANDVGIPRRVDEACDLIATRQVTRVPLGVIQPLNEDSNTDARPSGAARHFIMMASAGFDAHAVQGVNLKRKKILGKLEYFLSGLLSGLGYSWPPIRVQWNEGNECVTGYTVVVSKIRFYAGRFPIAPDGDIRQPYFNMCVFQGNRRRDMIRYLIAARWGRHIRMSDVIYRQARCVTLTAAAGVVPLQIDGDYFCHLPARVWLAPAALNLCMPEK
ncbi:MAG: diacylglycerol kinase family lipid kinase [Candidatus Sumerlaeota bacterium]|nr:diacylglycerol kinase family lipid kinase [Candidatus Sumerlaeota bacterium]